MTQPTTPWRRAAIGAHMSTAGGLAEAVARARSVDATALQIFVKSARTWRARAIPDAECEAFRRAIAEAALTRATLAHASYLINLASADAALRERSVAALGDELDRCAALGIPYLVLHPGAHRGDGEAAGIRRVSRALDRVLAGRRPRGRGVKLLLENTAGQGSTLGRRFAELGAMIRGSQAAGRLGICLDTCHALAAGYDFRDPAGYRRMIGELDREVGVGRLSAFHLNDSRFPLGSRRDRHEHVGRGEVGEAGFRQILGDRRFHGVPMVIETPKDDALTEDRVNLGRLRSWLPGDGR